MNNLLQVALSLFFNVQGWPNRITIASANLTLGHTLHQMQLITG